MVVGGIPREGYVAPPSSPTNSTVGTIWKLDARELESAMEEAQPPLFKGGDIIVNVSNKDEKAKEENLSEANPKDVNKGQSNGL